VYDDVVCHTFRGFGVCLCMMTLSVGTLQSSAWAGVHDPHIGTSDAPSVACKSVSGVCTCALAHCNTAEVDFSWV
jgi:hypothetical protein